MTIGVDNTSSGTLANASSLTVGHTCTGTESNGILIVTVQAIDSALGDRTISTVTHNGETLTHLAADADQPGDGLRTEIWYRINPTTGGGNIVVTPGGKCTDLSLGAISLTGVIESVPTELQTATGDSTPPTLDITTVDTSSYVVDSLASGESAGGKIYTSTPSGQIIHKTDVGGDVHASTYVDAGVAVTQTMSYSDDDSDTVWALSAVGIRALQDPPVVVLNSPADLAEISDTTPTLEFTGTDPEDEDVEYQIQVSTNEIFPTAGLIDSYSERNYDTDKAFSTESENKYAQSFTNTTETDLTSCKFYLKNPLAGESGWVRAKLYAHTGTFGVDGTPTGDELATSPGFPVENLPTSYEMVQFFFTTPYTMSADTKYFIVCVYDGVSDISIGTDDSSPTHSGNQASYNQSGGTWTADSGSDVPFEIYSDDRNIYYFDASDGGPTDPDGVWDNEADAFDGSILTDADYTGESGSSSTKFLQGDGTNAPTTGGTILQVSARLNATDPTSGLTLARVYTDGLGESLVTLALISETGWGWWDTLAVPTGGWTWQKISDLETKIWVQVAIGGSPNVRRVEIAVISAVSDTAAVNKLSSVPDATFTNTTDGGDTHPFDSGDKCDYTVQVGDALADDTYYWRVRGKDPTGSNTYGDWSSTRSFDLVTGAPGAVVQLNIGDNWKDYVAAKLNIGNVWKDVVGIQKNIGDTWKTVL